MTNEEQIKRLDRMLEIIDDASEDAKQELRALADELRAAAVGRLSSPAVRPAGGGGVGHE